MRRRHSAEELPPSIPWAEFLDGLAGRGEAVPRWEQGEHFTLVGPTGCGKTTVALALLDLRKYAVVIGTKPTGRDETLMGLVWRRNWRRPMEGPAPDDWRLIRNWPPPPDANRVVLWPTYRAFTDRAKQRTVIGHALAEMFTQGGWAIFADETNHLVDSLRLSDEMKELWRQGRSIRLSLVTALQRPRHAPLEAYDQATHLLLWRDNDAENLRRLGDLGGSVDSATIRETVIGLGKHEALYLNTRSGLMARTKWSR